MIQIICISPSVWGTAPARTEHLFSALPDAEMLFFEPPQLPFSSLRRPREGAKAAPNVTAYTLPCGIPGNEEATARLRQRSRKNAAFIHRCMAEHNFTAPLLWLRSPDSVELAFELNECSGLIYDCDQLWSAFPTDWEETLAAEADVILAASAFLRTRLLQYSENVALIPNGISRSQLPLSGTALPNGPADLARIPRPVFGTLDDADGFLDLTPVLSAAAAHPEWNFVFAGAVSSRNPGYSSLKKADNIFLLGKKSPSTFPSYLSGFDVCFSLTDSKNPDPVIVPERLYQYLASGKPIVAMSGEHMDSFFPDVIYPSHFSEEFCRDCERALAETASVLAEKRLQYALEAEWSRRGARFVHILDANGFLQNADTAAPGNAY